MTKKTLLFVLLLLSSSIYSQINEIGIFLGGSNYIGDLGPTTYLAPEKLSWGFVYKWNKSPRHAFTLSYTDATIASNDGNADQASRKLRGFDFENNIKELSLGLEFNFFEFDLHQYENQTTPYIRSGLNYFRYTSLFFNDKQALNYERRGSLAIPIVLGIKTRLNRRLILAFEAGARYTFIDDLDGSRARNKDLGQENFGNFNNNDWYVFSGVTLTYTFGKKTCYCAQ
ncbi:MAG: hypothetical protein QG594_1641 [Bacteroidota bacterium]|nr:hypothetical protein [Bacteroidota bacterium]